MNVAFRVDADRQIGTGHFTRCLALADQLRDAGMGVRFIGRRMLPHLAATLTARGYDFTPLTSRVAGASADLPHSAWLDATQEEDAAATAQVLAGDGCDWLVVDHYALDGRWESALRPYTRRILAIDDLADRTHDCDVLLDQNINAEGRYDGKVPAHCEQLLGPRYALLRDEFRVARTTAVPRSGPVTRALVSFGGTDAANATAVAIEALASVRPRIPHTDVVIGDQHPQRSDIETACRAHAFACHVQPTELAAMMAASDIAVGAAGVTMWERCAVGLPAVTIAVADNQRESLRAAALAGLVYAMPPTLVTAATLAAHLSAVLDNELLREMLSRNAMQRVDADGTVRVARAMNLDRLSLREAQPSDAASILEWRNDESVRRHARRQDLISAVEHQQWLDAVLADPNRLLLIGEYDGRSAGVVRFDITGERAEVSVYRVPGVAGGGIGVRLLRRAEEWLRHRRPHVTMISAEVLGDNPSSRHMLESAGYRLATSVYEKTFSA